MALDFFLELYGIMCVDYTTVKSMCCSPKIVVQCLLYFCFFKKSGSKNSEIELLEPHFVMFIILLVLHLNILCVGTC